VPALATLDRVEFAAQIRKVSFHRHAKLNRWEYRMEAPMSWPVDWVGSVSLDEPEYRIGGKWHPVPDADFSRDCEVTSPLDGAQSCWFQIPKAAEQLRAYVIYDTIMVGEQNFTLVPLVVKTVEFRVAK
jgi:hypothetical protein